ncbi:MAG: ribose-phosphate pyrophosphokinase [Candidatus Levyibacteriota bacterium]
MVPKVFSGSSNKPLAEKVAKILGLAISPLEIHVFPDGEKRVRVVESVVGLDTVVVQSAAAPVDENYMELFFIIDALRRSGAKSVTAVIPYLGYQRQDHVFREGEAVSLDVIIKALESLGATKIVTFDLHSIKIPELFSIPVSHLSALPLFAEKIKKIANCSLVSPDMGGVRRIKIISGMLGDLPYVTVVKNRDLTSGKITAEKIEGRVLRKAIIVDDMISSGKTVVAAADLLRKNGAQEIIVMATHAVLSGDSPEALQNSIISKVVVTDTIEISKEKHFAKLEVLSAADIIAGELATSR